MFGDGASVRASALRRASPPDSRRGILFAGHAQLFEQVAGPVGIVARREPGLDVGQGGGKAGEIGLLRQIADGGSRLQEAAAGIRLHQPGGDLQQARLARAVASDQRQAFARTHR